MAIRIIEFATGFQTDETPGSSVTASTISVTPSGDLGSTNVQAALTELQGDIDTLESGLSAHLTDPTDAHDASAISSVASGNLSATNVQSALNELQTDVDTRATAAALTSHTGNVSNPHSVTANQVLPSQTGNSGKVLGTDGTNTAWTTVATNPMTTSGDITYGGTSGAPTRLAANSTATKKWLRSLSSGTPTWEEVDQVKGDVSGTAKSSGYAGEMLGTQRTGTNGSSYSTRSTTSVTNTYSVVVSRTVDKGFYIVGFTASSTQSDGTNRRLDARLAVGGTAVTDPIPAVATSAVLQGVSQGGIPVLITADSTVIAVQAIMNGLSGSTSGNAHELWVTRIA